MKLNNINKINECLIKKHDKNNKIVVFNLDENYRDIIQHMEKILNAGDGSSLHIQDCIKANGFRIDLSAYNDEFYVYDNESWGDYEFSNFSFLGACFLWVVVGCAINGLLFCFKRLIVWLIK